MPSLSDLSSAIQVSGRIPDAERAVRFLRAVASALADWSGRPGQRLLKASLPAELLKGTGASGRSWDRARKAAAPDGDAVALHVEVARRAEEPDPGKVAVALQPALALLRDALPKAAVESLAAALPAPVALALRGASGEAPWPAIMVPQSHARPHPEAPRLPEA